MQNLTVDPFGIVGQVLGAQFRVDRLVGEGGFSAVYRGHHLGLEEPIAIKCLKLPPALSPALVDQFSKRFRDESRILYRLSQGNLNIVRSIAGGTWQAPTGLLVPFMILEWLEGRSLANEFTVRRTTGKQGRSLSEVLTLFDAAGDGLGYAHAQGVIHRDLNPGNLFLSATPQGTTMKVLDFGVAKILDESTLDIARSQTVGQIRIFAPAYGAPEQFDDGIGAVGAATDVYAFALILLEALRDRCVNDAKNLGEFAQRAVDGRNRPTPRSLGIDVPDEVEQVFARATKLDPRQRWQSAGEFWRALSLAANAASRDKHVQAAMETPSLGMPQRQLRSTQRGISPPAQAGRAGRTLPLGAVMLNVTGLAGAPPASGGSKDAPAPSLEDDELPTRVGSLPSVVAKGEEPEEEVTRVHAPTENVLRGLADADAQGQAPFVTMAQVSRDNRYPAAGNPLPAAGNPPSAAGGPHQGGQGQPMPPGFGQPPPTSQQPHRPPSGQHNLGQTMPLAGPHPLGLPSQQGGMGPAPAAGMPGGQGHFGAPQQPPMMQHHPQAMMQQAMMQQQQPIMQQGQPPYAQPPAYRMGESVSLPPGADAGPPPKNNTILFVGIGLGALALIGIIGGVAAVLTGKKDPSGTAGSASALASDRPSASAPPPPLPTTEPAPAAAAAVDASDTAPVDNGNAGALAATATATAAAPATATATAAATATATPPTPTSTPTTVTPPPQRVRPPPAPVAVKDAGLPADPNAFNESGARSKLAQANGVLVFCKKEGGVTGPGTASVTFASDGSVSAVSIDPPYAGTPAGDCVTGHFKRTKVSSFQGSPQTIKHSFVVPK